MQLHISSKSLWNLLSLCSSAAHFSSIYSLLDFSSGEAYETTEEQGQRNRHEADVIARIGDEETLHIASFRPSAMFVEGMGRNERRNQCLNPGVVILVKCPDDDIAGAATAAGLSSAASAAAAAAAIGRCAAPGRGIAAIGAITP